MDGHLWGSVANLDDFGIGFMIHSESAAGSKEWHRTANPVDLPSGVRLGGTVSAKEDERRYGGLGRTPLLCGLRNDG